MREIVMRVDSKQLQMGIKVEMEHTTDKAIAKKIALDHLHEIPDYYTRLLKMEREAGVISENPIRVQMPEKEIREARQARIPEEIITKMSQGLKLSERDKKIVRDHGKVYVPAFRKNNVLTVRPQLRDLPYKRGKSPKYL